MKSKSQNRKKRPYSRPRLVAYGDFRTLTRLKGGGSQDGGGPKPATKTTGAPG